MNGVELDEPLSAQNADDIVLNPLPFRRRAERATRSSAFSRRSVDLLDAGRRRRHKSAVDQEQRYPCPCCGHSVFAEPPGSEDICLVCFWEDDIQQLRWPSLAGLSNSVSLVEAQQNRAKFGAIEERFADDVRPATNDEPLDPTWHPIQNLDSFEGPDDSASWPEDSTRLYYWRANYWRGPATR